MCFAVDMLANIFAGGVKIDKISGNIWYKM